MDSDKIVSTSIGLLWIAGLAGGFYVHKAINDVDILKQESAVLERRADEADLRAKRIESKLDNEQKGIAEILKTMQELLSSHESRLAVIEEKMIRTDNDFKNITSEIKEMSVDQKSVLKSILTIEAQLNTFELAK